MGKKALLALLALACLWAGPLSTTAKANNMYQARIVTQESDNRMLIEGVCINNTDQDITLEYKLYVKGEDQHGNTSVSAQKGSISLNPFGEQTVAKVTVDIPIKEIKMKVFKKEQLVAEEAIPE